MPAAMRSFLFLFLLLSCLVISHPTIAQARSAFRKVLHRVHVATSVGYGRTYYSYQITDANSSSSIVMFRDGDELYIHNESAPHVAHVVRWFDDTYLRTRSYVEPKKLDATQKATHKIQFKGQGATIPISLLTYVDLWKKLRLGLGGTLFIDTLVELVPEGDKHQDLGTYVPRSKTHYRVRPCASLGYKVIENATFSTLLDVHAGFDFIHSSLSSAPINKLASTFSLGLSVEKHISEYFRVFGRTSYELGSISDSHHFDSADTSRFIVLLEQSSALFQVGISFNCPEIPRCPVPRCKVQAKHKHNGQAYRGVSMWKGRDARKRKLFTK